MIGAQKPITFFLIHSIRSSNGSLRRFLFLLIVSSNSSINLITEHAGPLSRSSFGGGEEKGLWDFTQFTGSESKRRPGFRYLWRTDSTKSLSGIFLGNEQRTADGDNAGPPNQLF